MFSATCKSSWSKVSRVCLLFGLMMNFSLETLFFLFSPNFVTFFTHIMLKLILGRYEGHFHEHILTLRSIGTLSEKHGKQVKCFVTLKYEV